MKTPTILVNICFSEVTPESAETGSESDRGFVEQDSEYTFSELVNKIRQGGFVQEGSTDWLSTGYSTTDYTTGTEQEETMHFSRNNPEWKRKYFWFALKLTNLKRKQWFAQYKAKN